MILEGADDADVQQVAWGSLFSLRLPLDWTWADEDGLVNIYRPDGVGSLQISIAARQTQVETVEVVAAELARDFARQRGWRDEDVMIQATQTSNGAASTFSYLESGSNAAFWQVWHVVSPRHVAFITYTCDPEDANKEAYDRNQIVDSLQWL